jgi:septum site-determining protein MinD
LSDAGYDVVLVDADLGMANLADVLGETAESGIHAVLAEEAAVDVILENEDGPDVVPGGETIDRFQAADPSNLTRVLAPLEAAYDLVLVDTGAGPCHETLVAAGLAHGAVLVTTPQDAAVADVAKTAEFVDHADAEIIGAVVTRARADTDLADVADRLGAPCSVSSRRTRQSARHRRRPALRARPTARSRRRWRRTTTTRARWTRPRASTATSPTGSRPAARTASLRTDGPRRPGRGAPAATGNTVRATTLLANGRVPSPS